MIPVIGDCNDAKGPRPILTFSENDWSGPITLPFLVDVNGQTFDRMFVHRDGYITLGAPTYGFGSPRIGFQSGQVQVSLPLEADASTSVSYLAAVDSAVFGGSSFAVSWTNLRLSGRPETFSGYIVVTDGGVDFDTVRCDTAPVRSAELNSPGCSAARTSTR